MPKAAGAGAAQLKALVDAAEAEVARLREISIEATKAFKLAKKAEKETPRESMRKAREEKEKLAKEVQYAVCLSGCTWPNT